MSDNINIGSIQAAVVIAGGMNNTVQSHTVQSGSVGARGDLDRSVTELRGLLSHLFGLSGQHAVSAHVRDLVSAAAAEAAKATLDISRLRALMDAVRADVGGEDPVGRAALNVLNVISVIDEAMQE